MEQCCGITVNGFRCKRKTRYRYCRYHKEMNNVKESGHEKIARMIKENEKERMVKKIKEFGIIVINERTKKLGISREKSVDEILEEENKRKEKIKEKIEEKLGVEKYSKEIKEEIKKNIKSWTKRELMKLIREEMIKEEIRMENKNKTIDFYFIKMDSKIKMEKERLRREWREFL